MEKLESESKFEAALTEHSPPEAKTNLPFATSYRGTHAVYTFQLSSGSPTNVP